MNDQTSGESVDGGDEDDVDGVDYFAFVAVISVFGKNGELSCSDEDRRKN